MENALDEGLEGVTSTTGLTGGDAVLIKEYLKQVNLYLVQHY